MSRMKPVDSRYYTLKGKIVLAQSLDELKRYEVRIRKSDFAKWRKNSLVSTLAQRQCELL
jgi:hypothetical protein